MTATIQAIDTDDETLYVLSRTGKDPVTAYWPHPLLEICPTAIRVPAYGSEVEWPSDIGEPVVIPREKWWVAGPLMRRGREHLGSPTRPKQQRKQKTVPARLGETRARAAWVMHHKADMSINQIARKMHVAWGFNSHKHLVSVISSAWKVMGLPARGRIEMTVLKSTTNGLSPRDHRLRSKRRREAGLTYQGMKPYQPECAREGCSRPSLKGGGFCYSHDPVTSVKARENCLAMKARQVAGLVDGTEAIGLVQTAYMEHGTWRSLQRLCGVRSEVLSRVALYDPGQLMKPHIVEKIVEGLGAYARREA